MASNPNLEAARSCATAAHPVFPLYGPHVGEPSPDDIHGAHTEEAIREWQHNKGKAPVGRPGFAPNGKDDATTDPDQVTFWWTTRPQSAIGMRTDGLLVLDPDNGKGQARLDALAAEHGPLPATLTARTPGGGRHLLYRTPDGVEVGNNYKALGDPENLHVRGGAAGYIVVAPSETKLGQYKWQCGRGTHAKRVPPIADAPDWLIELLTKPNGAHPAPRLVKPPASAATPYGQAAREAEAAKVAATGKGGRNEQLNESAFKLGQLEAGGELPEGDAEAALLHAGQIARLPLRETIRTVQGGLAAGRQVPRSAPEPQAPAETPPEPVDTSGFQAVTLEEFIAEDEPGGEALLGTADQAVIPEGGDVMVYGDGGAGKTTLVNDGLCHLASGDEWLGIPVAKKVRILVVENEGPRQLFRRKLRRKAEGWTGSPLEGRITIFQKPWARLSIGVKEHREWLAGYVRDHQIDLIVFGPLTASGMDEAGTLQDTRAFAALLDEIRAAAGRTITFVVIHHENKGGKVSGAWEGVGDTLIHVRSLGPGKTQVFFQKARWSSEWHRKKLDLDWADAEAFTITETPELTDEDVAEQIVAYVSEHPDTGWGKVEEAVKGVQDQRRRNIRDGLLAKGKLVNRTKDGLSSEVPERTAAHLFIADDPAIQHLRPGPDADGTQTEEQIELAA